MMFLITDLREGTCRPPYLSRTTYCFSFPSTLWGLLGVPLALTSTISAREAGLLETPHVRDKQPPCML